MEESLILGVLKLWNPWEKEIDYGILRNKYVDFIYKFMDNKEILLLKGIRRSGKTIIIKQLIKDKKIKAYIITARYSYLKNDLEEWLNKMKVNKYFSGIYYNQNDEQPHLFKERMIKKLNLDIFVEDNLDIVSYLSSKFKIYWIYNIFDKNHFYLDKFPNLKSTIKKIKENIL